MCSIPGLPTPGSELPVLITRVNQNPNCGFVELWVNLDDGKKHIYDQMREEIQIPTRKFTGSEGTPGDLCLVSISGTWHRARIVQIQSETYDVFLIDQGEPLTTTREALAWGQSDIFLLPPEIESCILANVRSLENGWPERVTRFLKSLPGKKFKGLVQHVLMPDRIILLDIPIVSKHMCKIGVLKRTPADEFKCHVQECLHLTKGDGSEVNLKNKETNLNVSCQLEKHNQYLYPELLTDNFETVCVTEVANPQYFFCKLLIFSKAVEILSEQIHQHYEESSTQTSLEEAQPQTCRDPCAAKGKDGRWHRSLLKQNMTSDGAVEVLHVDEGKTDFIAVGDIKPLHGKFLRMPVVTYPCSLEGVKDNGTGWTTAQTDYLKSLIPNRMAVVRFDRHNMSEDIYYVTLCAANGACINDYVLEKAGFRPLSKTDCDSIAQDEHISSPCPSALGDECRIKAQNKVSVNGHCLRRESSTSTKNLAVDGGKEDSPAPSTNDIHTKECSRNPDQLIKTNGHFSAGSHSNVQNGHDDVFPEGSSVNVKVSCIESLQKFWCQTTEDADSLRLLMQDLQDHYASAHPQPLVESICVARNPDDGMWYRAKIMATHNSPVVDVICIDYGQTLKVPLRDVRPIDPAFLRLNTQAFQCCLFNLKNPNNPTPFTRTDAALAEFQKIVDFGASSDVGLNCSIKSVSLDDEGLPLHAVDIETPSDSVCKILAQKCAQAETYMQIAPHVPLEVYSYSTHNIEVGLKEKVRVTSSENVHRFYCQLERNSHLFDEVMEHVKGLMDQPQSTDNPPGLNSICLARYTDDKWYRGQIAEMSPTLKVHFVDLARTLEVTEADIRPFPTGANNARSVPVQAVTLELFDVPDKVQPEVNQWFADHVVGNSLTISVVAKGPEGELIVELFNGSLNINVEVRERISKLTKQNMAGLIQRTDIQVSNSSKEGVPNKDCLMHEDRNVSRLTEMTEDNKVHCNGGMSAKDELKTSLQSITNVLMLKVEHGKNEERKTTLDPILEDIETSLTKTFIEDGQSNPENTQHSLLSALEENVNISTYKRPAISPSQTEEVYTSCIVGPDHFWCQYANTENIDQVSRLAQEAGQAPQDRMFPETLGPGSPCLALFSSDNQWYRAQVIHRADEEFKVIFIDYGKELNIDVKNVRNLPQSLLEKAPQALFCSLKGFDKSKGSWKYKACDDFYSFLIDKPLKLKVLDMEDTLEIAVPQYAVELECEGVNVNSAMQEYWESVVNECVTNGNPQTEISLQDDQTESNMTQLSDVNTWVFNRPYMFRNKTEMTYASCIVEPHHFWCQYANTEELDQVSRLAQEAGQAPQDRMFPETLGPGSPCLALFSSDNQWSRAQVIHRTDDTFHVIFIDFGNESDVDIKNVRQLPQSLLEKAPQAFFCSLFGFEKSKGSWNDKVYDDFYNLLINKPLKLTVLDMEDSSKITVPQFAVEVECNDVNVNSAMQKYWKADVKESVTTESPQIETSLQDGQTESNMTQHGVSNRNANTFLFKKPDITKSKTEMVRASCIVEPHYFWCQYTKTEHLNQVSRIAQEAGQAPQDKMFPETLRPGSPCLALSSSDNRWYRAQVIDRDDDKLKVINIDYGNESNVDIKNVRKLPQSLLEKAPQAFFCSLIGFEKSKGSWNDKVYDDFYSLLVDKPLKLTVLDMKDSSEIAVPQYDVDMECEGVNVNSAMQKYWKAVAKECVTTESPEIETSLQDDQTESNLTHLSVSNRNVNTCKFHKPDVSKTKTEMAYASCIVEPHHFWCQYANTEDLDQVSRLAQEAGQAPQDRMFPETLGPGSPCLALFSSDNQWYRAQVIHRADEEFKVIFIDYGKELNIDVKNVRNLPQSLLEKAPQAFFCSLKGFDKSKGSWKYKACDDFYSFLIDKPLKLKVLDMEDTLEIAVPQYAVELECEGVNVNSAMQEYWESVVNECVTNGNPQTEISLQDDQTESNMTHLSVSNINVNTCKFHKPDVSKTKTEMAYASCIVEPHHFWCQYTNTEDLDQVSRLAQEAGQAPQDSMFPETLGPGSPCLALFSSDNQWYRAQVIHRADEEFKVIFIDYGNESNVDVKNVRNLPQSLLEKAPQAFFCSLKGFDKSKGSWKDEVFDDFYSLLVDKPLKLTVLDMKDSSEIAVPQYEVDMECEGVNVNSAMQKYWKAVVKECVTKASPEIETSLQDDQTESNMTHLSVSNINVNTCKFCKPDVSKTKTEMAYASCIVEPHHFWCQYTNTEDLDQVSRLAQEAGQAPQDRMFPETLGPGSPCLALFSSDNQWYRAQVIQRTDEEFKVLFIDYGNESNVDIKNVRTLPQILLEKAPQAFFCSLKGFDKSKGSWKDEVYDDFYSLLVDKPLKLTVLDMKDSSEIAVPQYEVDMECEGVNVNSAMQKYWKAVVKECVTKASPEIETSLQDDQTESNMTHLSVSNRNVNTCKFCKPDVSKTKTEMAYASCIVEPHHFWCQYTNTEDLDQVSRLAQEAGQAPQDRMFPETLGPGSPCLALFSSDNQWYRAQVIERADEEFKVTFIDYGNESNVDIKNVRNLPQSLLEKAPQAFFCSLKGFDKSKGSWKDEVYDDFYSLLVDKPLKLTVLDMKDSSEIAVPQYEVDMECEGVNVNSAMQKYWKAVVKECVTKASPEIETSLQDDPTESNMTHLSVSNRNVNTCKFCKPDVSKTKTEMAYASCIVEPHHFWCQYTNTEDLDQVSRLAQEAGQAPQDRMFPETLGPGSPCLALFSSDNQWYRAQVIQRTDEEFKVLFIDYGNESNVDIKNVRTLPQILLEKAPQAFFCSLKGFDKSKGSWKDKVYDDFYSLLVDKPLKVTVFNMEDNAEIAVTQYATQIECDGVIVNTLMEKYWTGLNTDHALAGGLESVQDNEEF